MEDDVRQSSTDRYALSQAYRWRAERDQARQELQELQELQEIQARLMPEGMEWLLEVWPRWSNGEYCGFGDWWKAERYGDYEPRQLRRLVIYTPELLDEWGQGDGESYGYEWDFMRPGELDYRPDRVEPPAPAVLASDGEPLEVGQTVYMLNDDRPYTVKKVETNRVSVNAGEGAYDVWKAPTYLTHQRPVLDADGVPIREGDKVWIVENGHGPRIVKEMYGPSCVHLLGISASYRADQLTHTKPEPPDSWERIEEDAGCTATKYNERRGTIFTTKQQVARDLVRRAKKLAGVGE